MSEETHETAYNPFKVENVEPNETAFDRALHNIMKTPDGRTVVAEIVSWTRIYDEAFNGNSTDIYEKGKRHIGLQLLAAMDNVDPTMYPRMLLEVAKQEQRERLANKTGE